jgi:hypothetical protein
MGGLLMFLFFNGQHKEVPFLRWKKEVTQKWNSPPRCIRRTALHVVLVVAVEVVPLLWSFPHGTLAEITRATHALVTIKMKEHIKEQDGNKRNQSPCASI